MNNKTNLVTIMLFSLAHMAIQAMDDFYKPSYEEEIARRMEWDNYSVHGDPKCAEQSATHNHVVEALRLIHKSYDSLIQGPYDYRAHKTISELEQESMEYVALLKEDFDKRKENSVKLKLRLATYESYFNDLVKAIGYKQLIENRTIQEEKPDNFTQWQLYGYCNRLTERIEAHERWLSAVRKTGEEHYTFLHVISAPEKDDKKYRTDDPQVRAQCWKQCFKNRVLESWKQHYINEREDSVWRMLSPASVALIQNNLDKGFEGKETIPNLINIGTSIQPEKNILASLFDNEGKIKKPNNLLLGINGWRDAQ